MMRKRRHRFAVFFFVNVFDLAFDPFFFDLPLLLPRRSPGFSSIPCSAFWPRPITAGKKKNFCAPIAASIAMPPSANTNVFAPAS